MQAGGRGQAGGLAAGQCSGGQELQLRFWEKGRGAGYAGSGRGQHGQCSGAGGTALGGLRGSWR